MPNYILCTDTNMLLHLLFHIAGGRTHRTTGAGGGTFWCPNCFEENPYLLVHEQDWRTLLGCAIAPLGTPTEWVVCSACQSRMGREVLGYDRDTILAAINPWTCSHCGKRNPDDREHCWHCGISMYSHD